MGRVAFDIKSATPRWAIEHVTIDLSTFAHPIKDTLNLDPIDTEQFRLSDAQIRSFHHQGFIVGNATLTDEFLNWLGNDLEALISKDNVNNPLWHECHLNECANGTDVLFHALGAWRIAESFHDLLWQPAITIPATQLLNADVRFWHDQLFYKPPEHGGAVAWHQDYSYWTRTTPMAHLTCWVALEDATVKNGCLHYVPGSCDWKLLPITGLADDMESIRNVLSSEQYRKLQNPSPVQLRRGQMVFHHPLTVHGSFQNTTSKSRPAAVVNMIADGVLSNSLEPLLPGIPPLPAGEQLGGQFFPILRKQAKTP
jgi:ectoine hydroxylase-related dioxygenase (phytanoyl-CoA dioxygenase family)